MPDRPEVRMTPNPFPVHFLEQLEREIKRRQDELVALQHAREVLLGAKLMIHAPVPATAAVRRAQARIVGSRPQTVADAVESLLQKVADAMHVQEMIPKLEQMHGIKISSKNLVNTLNRWVSRGRRFQRTEPNTFTLRVDGAASEVEEPQRAANGGRRRHR